LKSSTPPGTHENGILFSGDTVYEGELYIQLPDSDFCAYFESLERLVRMMSSISVIFPSHGKSPLIPGFINNILSVFSDIDQGGIEYWYESSPWGRIRVYEAGGIQVFLKNDFNK
jgi:glyoxylase-like metal-dependent hydrolase (beta-lactamase superfamily II)